MFKEEDSMMVMAMQNYDAVHCFHFESFLEDYKRFVSVKKLFRKYVKRDSIKHHLVLNHIIILFNCFGEATSTILFSILDEECFPALKTFLKFLNRLHEIIITTEGKVIVTQNVPEDDEILKELQRI